MQPKFHPPFRATIRVGIEVWLSDPDTGEDGILDEVDYYTLDSSSEEWERNKNEIQARYLDSYRGFKGRVYLLEPGFTSNGIPWEYGEEWVWSPEESRWERNPV